jgi:hypothetical protein
MPFEPKKTKNWTDSERPSNGLSITPIKEEAMVEEYSAKRC